MRSNNHGKAKLIVCSDIHLSDTAPIFRSAEKDWFQAMERPLRELQELQITLGVPIFCAGDIFDKWKASPKLINFAYHYLPTMWTIPGQHDLPYHSYGLINESAYSTLLHLGTTNHLATKNIPEMTIHPYGWSTTLKEPELDPGRKNIALIHKYVWTKGHSFPGADDHGHVESIIDALPNMDLIVCGDNHSGFEYESDDGVRVFNCGTFMRRTVKDAEYQPRVGIVFEDATVVPYELDTSEEKYLVPEEIEALSNLRLDDLERQLKRLGDTSIDFITEMRNYCSLENFSPRAIEIVERILNESDRV